MFKGIFRRFPLLLLGWAVRYFPILRIFEGQIPPGQMLLDIGSGSFGLAAFYHRPFVGCDLEFPRTPKHPMLPVRCSGAQLPFADASFAAVVASDVLEHVPPQYRAAVVQESLRVARKLVVFGFPSGTQAWESDRNFRDHLRARAIPVPDWLDEHMRDAFPDASLFEALGPEWSVETFGNDNLSFNEWTNRCDLSRLAKGFFWMLLTIAPQLVGRLLRLADRPPFYRLIVVATRKANAGGESRA